MDEQLQRTGVPSQELLDKFKPPKERLEKGPVVMVECFEEIPCDPCNKACKFGAIKPFNDINDLPDIDFDTCNGCTICVGYCPGLAIFIMDETYSEDTASVTIPYEFLPLPEKGEIVKGLDRNGEYVTDAKVAKVKESGRKNNTYVITLEVPKGYSLTVRSMDFK